MAINEELALARPLDLIYAITECQRAKEPKRRKPHSESYNRWRQSLPAHCFRRDYFDRCSPTHKCPYNK